MGLHIMGLEYEKNNHIMDGGWDGDTTKGCTLSFAIGVFISVDLSIVKAAIFTVNKDEPRNPGKMPSS